ncbi:MAG: RES domain-containing protein [Bacteroidales bacterium]|nr:RES domain-containing protein [Bacteroidales bacterium]
MDIKEIEEIYRYSYNKYDDLYNYFLYKCDFNILYTRLSIGFITYRIRDFTHFEEIKKKENVQYPKEVKSYSRIGKPGQVWFYISDDLNATYAEMLPIWLKNKRYGETFYTVVSIWQVREPIKVLIIPEFTNTNAICKVLNFEPYKEHIDFWKHVVRRFSENSVDNENVYEFTSAFANSLITKSKIEGQDIKGIFYPSVQMLEKSNLALLPSVVDTDEIALIRLAKIEYQKSRILNNQGNPKYRPVGEYIYGYYDSDMDIINWD